jgi:hypothetical protein
MGRATLIGFSAVAMWALLALLTEASGAVPPLLLLAITFTIGMCVGLAARLFMPPADKTRKRPRQVLIAAELSLRILAACVFITGGAALAAKSLFLRRPAVSGANA